MLALSLPNDSHSLCVYFLFWTGQQAYRETQLSYLVLEIVLSKLLGDGGMDALLYYVSLKNHLLAGLNI